MIGTVTGALDRRFLLNAVLPSALFVLLAGFVWLAGADPAVAADRWDDAGGFALLVLVAATGLLACVVSAATPALLRLYEGYWGTPPGRLLAAWGRRRHQRRLAALARDPDAYPQIHLRYPLPSQPGEVMPTRFGNVLRSAELYPKDRYGIDTAVVWPRLYQVLPERQVTQIAAARGGIDLMVTISALASMFAVAGGGYLLATGAPWWRFLLCLWGGAGVAWLAYRGAVATAVTYGQHLRTAFDVHRGELLRQLGLTEEPGLWRRLAQHWYRNVPLDAELEPELGDDDADDPTGFAVSVGVLVTACFLVAGIAGAVALA
ncbi:MAG: hypothetical protein ACRDT4_22945 [Micromonosporaceae bacterium]